MATTYFRVPVGSRFFSLLLSREQSSEHRTKIIYSLNKTKKHGDFGKNNSLIWDNQQGYSSSGISSKAFFTLSLYALPMLRVTILSYPIFKSTFVADFLFKKFRLAT